MQKIEESEEILKTIKESKQKVSVNRILEYETENQKRDAYKSLTEQDIELNADYLNWSLVCRLSPIHTFSDNFFIKFHEKIEWDNVLGRHDASEEFILQYEEFIPDHNKFWIVGLKKRSEDFIRHFIPKFGISGFIVHSKLPEALLREHSESIDFEAVIRYQSISRSFIYDFKDKFNENAWTLLSKNFSGWTMDMVEDFKNEIDWPAFLFSNNLKEDVILKYGAYILAGHIKAHQETRVSQKLDENQKIISNYNSYGYGIIGG